MIVERYCKLFVEYDYDIQVGDVFKEPMKGWERHVKAVLDSKNLLIWNEFAASQAEKDLPLAERTSGLIIQEAKHLLQYYWGPLRGGEYKVNEKGGYEYLGGVWVPPTFPVSVRVEPGWMEPDYWNTSPRQDALKGKPNMVELAPLETLIRKLAERNT